MENRGRCPVVNAGIFIGYYPDTTSWLKQDGSGKGMQESKADPA